MTRRRSPPENSARSSSSASSRAIPITSAESGDADPVIRVCSSYLATEQRREHLLVRSGNVEAWLADHHDWFSLTRVQRRAVREAQALYDINDEIEQMGKTSAGLIEKLGRMCGQNVFSAIAKLEVVARAIEPDDYPPAHSVLRGAISDLKRLLPSR